MFIILVLILLTFSSAHRQHASLSNRRNQEQVKAEENEIGKHKQKEIKNDKNDEDKELNDIRSLLKTIVDDKSEDDNKSRDKNVDVSKPRHELHEIRKDILQRKIGNGGKRRKHRKHFRKQFSKDRRKITTQSTTTTKKYKYFADKIFRKEKTSQNFFSSFKDRSVWLGVATGVVTVVVITLFGAIIYLVIQKIRRRDKCIDLKNLSLCDIGDGKMKDPVYIRLSQLHDPRKGPQYVVSVLDQSNNFSINTSSSSSSTEEEIFNCSEARSPNKSYSTHHRINMTSTPIKTPVRLNDKKSLSRCTRKSLSFSGGNSPVSPLAMTPPFSSPSKKYRNG